MREKKFQKIEIEKIELNNGQLEGLPRNPRFIRDEKFRDLVQSIEHSPEFLEARPLLVYPLDNKKYVALCGNMRLRACRELGMAEAPCYVFPKSTPMEKLREYAIKDNLPYGQTDWDILKEWDVEELKEWSFDLPEEWLNDELGDFPTEEPTEEPQKSDAVEAMLNTTTEQIAADVIAQYDKLGGFSFVTPNTAKFDFIRFAYYGKDYPRYNSLAFHPKQFITQGDNYSTYEGLKMVAEGKTKGERLRFVCQDKFRAIISGSLAFGGAKMPLDFPAELARDLINEFAGEGGRVLDPCAGWGGRLVGFLASDAAEYDGTDASPNQCEGDRLIFDTFRDTMQGEKSATITCSPFEKRTLQGDYFDMAITSPPYFDTEKYIGGEQSWSAGSYEHWRDSFYQQLIAKVFGALKPGGVFCLQVGSQRYPLLNDGTRIAESVGFSVEEVRPTEMVNNQMKTEEMKGEVVVILRKK